jgi:hypothetical protein
MLASWGAAWREGKHLCLVAELGRSNAAPLQVLSRVVSVLRAWCYCV